MKRVLVTGGAKIGKAGVASIVYKWGISFSGAIVYDYLMQSGLPEDIYINNIRSKKSKIFTMDNDSRSIIAIICWVRDIIRKNRYETIHINTDSAYVAAAYIFASKCGGVKNIYVHSHCTCIDDNNKIWRYIKTAIHFACRPYVRKNTNLYLACSKSACQWMFGKSAVSSKKYIFVENGVEVDKYLFKKELRENKRRELGLNNEYVLGNIGRFSYQKNHEKLIDIFFEYQRKNNNSVLILVGEGELEDRIRRKIERYGIVDKVLLLGHRNDINELLQAMDVLVMPSRFEGLPVTAVEAQMASLPCVLSNTITEEAKFTDNVKYVSIQNTKEWVDSIDDLQSSIRPYDEKILFDSLFNVINASKKLENILKK